MKTAPVAAEKGVKTRGLSDARALWEVTTVREAVAPVPETPTAATIPEERGTRAKAVVTPVEAPTVPKLKVVGVLGEASTETPLGPTDQLSPRRLLMVQPAEDEPRTFHPLRRFFAVPIN